MIAALLVGLLLGTGIGALLGLLLASNRAARRLAEDRAGQAAALATTAADRARLVSELDRAEDRNRVAEDQRRQLVGEFAELSRQALSQNSEEFLRLADERLTKAQQAATGELEQRKQSIEQVLTPLREQLGHYERGLRQMELDRQEAYTGLTEQVRQLSTSQDRLQSETRNLVTALRAPATRGRWGELQLRRVVEMAGMLEHCDFDLQVTLVGHDGRLRPDMVVHLPGGHHVVVDAKVPMQAFLDANDATDEDLRRDHLVSHARQLRAHVDALAKKAYWREVEGSTEFVVAFVPGDPLLAAAYDHDASLLEHSVASKVLLATPTTLIGLLRTVAQGWREEAMAENAREVQQMAQELYRRLSTFGEHLAKTGRSLAGAVDSYNKAVGSLERNVLPQARRFHELGVVVGADRELPELDPIDAVARPVQAPEPAGPPAGVLPLPTAGSEVSLWPSAAEG